MAVEMSTPLTATDETKKDCGCGCNGTDKKCAGHDDDAQRDWIIGGIVAIGLIVLCWAAWKYDWLKKATKATSEIL